MRLILLSLTLMAPTITALTSCSTGNYLKECRQVCFSRSVALYEDTETMCQCNLQKRR